MASHRDVGGEASGLRTMVGLAHEAMTAAAAAVVPHGLSLHGNTCSVVRPLGGMAE